MFSYTDDAIVTSSLTGRHLSTVIRRPCVLMSGWSEHAEAICKVLNELDSSSPLKPYFPLSKIRIRIDPTRPFGDQMPPAGPAPDDTVNAAIREALRGEVPPAGPTTAQLIDAEPSPTVPSERIAELEKQLCDATTKLTAGVKSVGASYVYIEEGHVRHASR